MQFPAETVIGEHWSKISLHQLHSTLRVRLITQVQSCQHEKHRYNSQARTLLAISFLTQVDLEQPPRVPNGASIRAHDGREWK